MMTLKLSYRSMWPDHNPYKTPKDFFLFTLEQHYTVVIDNENPDVVIYSVFGPVPTASEYTSNPVMIAYSGESYDAEGKSDIKFGFHTHDHPAYHRLPIWCLYINWDPDAAAHPLNINSIRNRHKNTIAMPEKFCNFTYRNPVKSRIEFFMALNSRRKVESTGPLYNNTRVLLEDKPVALQQYRFTIAYENKQQPGYVTEKLLEPLAAGSVPVYWGGSQCAEDFNPAAFINADDFGSQDQLINYIEHVNNNQDLWQQYVTAPIFLKHQDWPALIFDIIYAKLADKKPHLVLDVA
jgi:hypothetical protein